MHDQDPAPALSRRTLLSGASLLTLTAVAGCGGEEPDDPTRGRLLGATADVPVTGGIVLPERRVVVTQPVRGEFHAFSAVCTHQACLVRDVGPETIDCPCHGSRFDVRDGSVVRGPAQESLPRIAIRVEGTSIARA